MQTHHKLSVAQKQPSRYHQQFIFQQTASTQVKSSPITGRAGPEGSRKLRLLDFNAMARYGGRLSALRTGRLYPQEHSWYSFSLGAESTQVALRKRFRKHSNEAFVSYNSRNICCPGRVIIVTYTECVPVALIIQHAMRMPRVSILSSVACLSVPYLYIIWEIARSSGEKNY